MGGYLRTELHGAGPDTRKLRVIQRRTAFFRFLQKLLMGFLCISQPLDDSASVMGHGLVPGTLRDLPLRRVPLRKTVCQELINGNFAVIHLDHRILYPKQEPGAILGPVIEVRVIGDQSVFP